MPGPITCWRSVRRDGGWTRIIFDTRLFIHTAAPKMAGHIRSRFIYLRKQRRNSGAHGGQCIIKSEHYVIIMQSYNTSTEDSTGDQALLITIFDVLRQVQ